jgi:hypothetical protein
VTVTYYVGAAGSAAFTTANSCNVTGLVAATVGTDLANTTVINQDQAKVIVKDALGNQVCRDVTSTYAGGLFGVDKIAPLAAYTTATPPAGFPYTGVADQTGYSSVTKGFNLTFSDSISGFPLATGSSPFRGTLTRNFYGTPSAADCVVGNYITATKVCADTAISNVAGNVTVPSWTETTTLTGLLGGFQYTNGTGVVGYYTAKLTIADVAGNVGPTLTRTAAFDNVPPSAAAPTQSPAAVVSLGSVTVSSAAADLLNLISSKANLTYPTLITFGNVTGNVLGTFGQFVTSATATATLSNVYRGLQNGQSGTITGAVVAPAATVTVTDVGGNSTTSAASTIVMVTPTPVLAPIFVGNTLSLSSSAAAGTATASVATTNLTFQVGGLSSDVNFQSQPFAVVEIYKANSAGTEYSLVATLTSASVVDNTTTGARTFTYLASGVALSPGTGGGASAAAANTFVAIGRNAAGDAVLSPAVTQNNP